MEGREIMLGTWLRRGSISLLAAGTLVTGSSAQNSAAPEEFTLELDANFIAQSPGHWESSGAFTDEGKILAVTKHEPNGYPHSRGPLSVIETLSGSSGTFTWKFTRNFTPVTPGPPAGPVFLTNGNWQMISGTGAYIGITGQGTFTGTLNVETGDFHDSYKGHVKLGGTSAFEFRQVPGQ
jgi:hypothetical protein